MDRVEHLDIFKPKLFPRSLSSSELHKAQLHSEKLVEMRPGSKSVVENLFHYLWAKNELFGTGPLVYLPDTVIYKYRQPSFWYFTSTKPVEQRDHYLQSKSRSQSEGVLQHQSKDKSQPL